ncbi:MAG: DUF4347 domain-containing protein, partial [Gammaproteobacteria bacterium]
AGDALLATPSTLPAEFRALTEVGKPSVVTTAAVAPVQRSNELVFVDTATPDYEALVEAMRSAAQADGLNVEFVLIDGDRDGVQKITETLAQRKDLDAIHVISHARDGVVQLGSTQLDFETLVKRATQVKSWGNALAADGDILFYGCDLAASAEGKSLLEALSRLTGADVAASEDKTGAAARGGDWALEFKTGAIEATVIVSLPMQGEWDHLLVVYDVTTAADAGAGSLRDAITQANASVGVADTITFSIGSGIATINLASALPNIIGQVTIDGTTQEGYTGTPLIEINRNTAPAAANGLVLAAGSDGSTIRSLSIQSFGANGILVQSASNVIAGNYVGLDADGTTVRGNNTGGTAFQGGILVQSANNIIGGTAAGDRNVVSDNRGGANGFGIGLVGDGADNNRILGNYIGTNAGGTLNRGNAGDGIYIDGGDNNTIGGATTGARNVIAANGDDGITVDNRTNAPTGNIIQGNWIGQNSASAALGNGDDGIQLSGGGTVDNWVGGIGPGVGNVIRANGEHGVEVQSDGADRNRILGNSIYASVGLGIDLNNPTDAVTPNDGGDGDVTSNQGQNFPVFTTVTYTGAALRLQGNLDTGAGTYRLEFFLSVAGDPEGQTYLGGYDLTKAAGVAAFDITFAGVAAGIVTATATDSLGNTSEFSASVAVPGASGAGNTITGAVYEDLNGDANLGDAVGAAGVTVRLFQDNGNDATDAIGTDGLARTAVTDANGNYTFIGLTNGARYWVVVDSKTINPSNVYNAGSGIGNVWAEQTYGDNLATAGAPDLGARYGGRNANLSDDASAASSAEHVLRAEIPAGGGNVAGANFGFSFNVVTNTLAGDNTDHDGVATARTVQGSLRQFIQNA